MSSEALPRDRLSPAGMPDPSRAAAYGVVPLPPSSTDAALASSMAGLALPPGPASPAGAFSAFGTYSGSGSPAAARADADAWYGQAAAGVSAYSGLANSLASAAPSLFPLAYSSSHFAGPLTGLGVGAAMQPWYPSLNPGLVAGYSQYAPGVDGFAPTATHMYHDGLVPHEYTPVTRPPPKNPFKPGTMTGSYGPAAAAAAAASAWNTTGRCVWVGGIPANATADELLNLVKFGPVENVKSLVGKNCVFISFLDGATAAAFFADARVKKLTIRGSDLKVGWAKPSVVPAHIQAEVDRHQATRCVFLGDLTEADTQDQIAEHMRHFGEIDQVKIVAQPNKIAFVHYLSIADAIRAVKEVPSMPEYAGKRVGYGKDRCAYVPRAQQPQVLKIQEDAYQKEVSNWMRDNAATPNFDSAALLTPVSAGYPAFGSPRHAGVAPGQYGEASKSRNVYLGNLHPDTTVEDLCNNIRGGLIESIHIVKDKHCAFVTFVHVEAAVRFLEHARASMMTVRSRRVRLGHGKPVGPVAPDLLREINDGLTRNVYIGGIEDSEYYTLAKLREDFGQYGELEQVNFLRVNAENGDGGKLVAFVNFTSISAARTALEAVKSLPDYAKLRVAHGKDRCANMPRASFSHEAAGPGSGGRPRRVSPATHQSRESVGTSGSSDIVGQAINAALEVEPKDGADMSLSASASSINGAETVATSVRSSPALAAKAAVDAVPAVA